MDVLEETFWLSVIEPVRTEADWPQTVTQHDWQVTLTSESTLHSRLSSAPFRTSPVFPVTPSFEVPDFDAGTLYFAFACFDPAFPVLARLQESAQPTIARGLLFSLGLASVVGWSDDSGLLAAIEEVAGERARASEVWTVERGRITHIECSLPDPPALGSRLGEFPRYDNLPVPARAAVDEFVSTIALLIEKIALHVPSELPIIDGIIVLVRELVDEMVFASQPDTKTPPTTLGTYAKDDFQTDGGLADTVFNQAWDRLIQINSALSYFPTQALSGAIPILERRSLIRRNSLLGVGSATLALTRLASSIERAFAAGALENVIEDYASTARPLPGADPLPQYDPRRWAEFSLNQWNDRVSPREPYVKVPYFSGRLGFRETEYTISAALKALSGGAHPEWSVLTLTHEMVHGHVRNLLTLIFQGDPDAMPGSRWNLFYERFAAEAIDLRTTPDDLTLLDSLRAIVLTYCCMVPTHGSLTRPRGMATVEQSGVQIAFDCRLPSADGLRALFESEYRNMSEIIVHVLDLHYFYGSRLNTYLPLIWRSWATMPQVRTDISQYVLRSLLVTSTKSTGTPYSRFAEDRARLVEILTPLAAVDHRGVQTIRDALALLNNDEEVRTLLYPYCSSLRIADMADHVLTSSVIRGAVTGFDRHVARTEDPSEFEDLMEYDMPDGFVDTFVEAPALLLADRVSRRVSDGDGPNIERETVQLFLACASRVDPEEGRDAASHSE